ncbi:MAG: phosphatidylserine/phosphatidylglycerophosphate/cardiolipin synthase family protein [Rudaea sp.]
MTRLRQFALVPIALSMLLGGCAVDHVRARRALATADAAQDRTLTCHSADACAIASPYRALAARALAESTPGKPVHYLNLLDKGEDALLLRVHLIRAARKSIDVQTFIFAEDDAGYLMLNELVNAARRGVHVRVLVDQLFSLDDVELLARLARAHVNFELRVYNPTFHRATTPPLEFAAGIVCCFFNFNQRMHNKLLLIDNEIGIAGGRNYEDRYFDWDDDFDYRDRDLLVTGPVAAAMQQSFESFWRHPRSVPLSRLRDVSARILNDGINAPAYQAHAYKNPARVEALSRHADSSEYIQRHFIDSAMRVGDVEYFSDRPEKFDDPNTQRDNELSHHIVELLSSARSEIVLQTPYLVLSRAARRVFKHQHRKYPKLRVRVSTNSLAATDAFYVYALSYKYKKRYLKLGFEIHEFKPFPAEADDLIADYEELGDGPNNNRRYQKYGRAPLTEHGVRLGLHAKSIVIDGTIGMIGSHNFDPRSDHYNTESGFIVHDRAFAQRLRAAILRDSEPQNAWTIARRQGNSWLSKLNRKIGDLSASLPLFDLWPYRYASSFEIQPGCKPIRPGARGFYSCYRDVGDFPEVDLPLKTIYTRIVTAFGAGLHSIL